ncbi:hypothetical protein [Acetivibrio saccincola]|uniref:hypothetical protein n=1 Tax=Acetivibrio saccincola TaxID=1677857 RepID=UPI001692E66E|nr:hypothetical protein [Acetivibrio saccincola]NLW26621.1 hypothetical protein [Acetivibrio saccincola]
MHPKGIQEKNNIFKELIVYPLIFVALVFLSWYYFLLPEGRWYHAKEQVYFLIFSVCAFFLAISIKKIFVFFLKGKNAEFIEKLIVILGTGVALFLFFYYISDYQNLKDASIGILFFTIAVILHKISELYRSGIYSESIIIAGSYILAGVTVEIAYSSLWPEPDKEHSINVILMLSFIILSVLQLISLIDVTEKQSLIKISSWLKRNHLLKFIIISIALFMLIDVRRVILLKDVKTGWIFVFVVLLVVFILLIASIRRVIKEEPDVRLKKHLQRITYDKIMDISSISKYVDDFVMTGRKSGLTSYLFYMAYRVEIPVVTASRIIAPILEHKDIEVTEIMSAKNYRVIEERNKQNRIKVVKDVTDNLELYGRGRYYEYRGNSAINTKGNR